MVMTRPAAFHVRKFLMKNMIPTNSGLIISPMHYVLQTYVSLGILFSHLRCADQFSYNVDG